MSLNCTRRWLAVIALAVSSHLASAQSQFKILHGFTGMNGDGGGLQGSVALDEQGNVYGTTFGGGTYNAGTVFELSPAPNAEWNETILHSFDGYGDGGGPLGGPIVDGEGNVYGTTDDDGPYHGGTAFELSPSPNGWTEQILHNFCSQPDCEDGASSWASLTIDGAGNLFGTGHVAFELSRNFNGTWIETTLHVFTGQNGDGVTPRTGVIFDRAGNLYGTAGGGGSPKCYGGGCGTVYELRPILDGPDGGWSESILHAFGFSQNDGQLPSLGELAIDKTGNLYGTTSQGGANLCFAGCGTILELSRSSTGRWIEKILYNFKFDASGFDPGGGVVIDKVGNLYGTTIEGGSQNCGCGVVYKLSPQPGGQWQYTVLHNFIGIDGAQPDANLTLDTQGNLYGTTLTGGPGGAGVVFELTP